MFSDQIIRDGAPFYIEEVGSNSSRLNLSVGLLLTNTEKYWLGVSVDYINQPEYSFLGTNSFLAIKTSVHGGYSFE